MTDITQKIFVVKNNYENLFHLTTVVFIVLKLSETVDWSWWLVLLPSLIPLGIAAAYIIVAGLVLLTAQIVQMITRTQREDLRKLRRQILVDKIKNKK